MKNAKLHGRTPIISQLGDTRWSGTDGANGTTLEREGDRVVRIFPPMRYAIAMPSPEATSGFVV